MRLVLRRAGVFKYFVTNLAGKGISSLIPTKYVGELVVGVRLKSTLEVRQRIAFPVIRGGAIR
jgi:hypothetical protein